LTVFFAAIALGCSSADKDDSAVSSDSDGGGSDDGGSDDGGSDDGGSGDGSSGDGSSGDGSSGDDGSADLDWDSLNGDVPSSPVSVPEFAATNMDGTARSREDVLGHPTVMWFYPAAATAG
jgi:hypothetical protein